MSIPPKEITAAILTTGTAVAGDPCHPGSEPLVELVRARLRHQVGRTLVQVSHPSQLSHSPPLDMVLTPADDALDTVAALLEACRSEYLLLVPLVTPHLPLDLAPRLAAALRPGDECLLADDGTHVRPLYALLRRSSCLLRLRERQAEGGRRSYAWLYACRHRRIDFRDRLEGFVCTGSWPRAQALRGRESVG